MAPRLLSSEASARSRVTECLMSPTLSILVPTRNRSQYVVPCVRMLLSDADTSLEVVVSDNSTDELSRERLAPFLADKRFTYVRKPAPLTVHENFATALEHSRGEYVGFLGDDDAVIGGVGGVARWARDLGLDAVVGPHLAIYLWPDVRLGLYGSRLSGTLRVKRYSGDAVFPDPRDELFGVCRRGGIDFGRLPRSYHGIVARRCLESVRELAGTYFPGPTPDMSSAAALAHVVTRYAWVDAPIFVSGTGMGSAGGAGAAKKHDWSLEAAPWITPESVRRWSSWTPRRCVAPTLWAEGVIQASRAVGDDEAVESFDFGALYGDVAAFHWQHRSAILQAARALRLDQGLDTFETLLLASSASASFLRAWAARGKSLVENTLAVAGLSANTIVRDLDGVEAAYLALNGIVAGGPVPAFASRG